MNAHARKDMVSRHTAAAKVSTVANGTACIQEFVLKFIRGKGGVELTAQKCQGFYDLTHLLLVVAFGAGDFGIGSPDDAAGVVFDAAFWGTASAAFDSFIACRLAHLFVFFRALSWAFPASERVRKISRNAGPSVASSFDFVKSMN